MSERFEDYRCDGPPTLRDGRLEASGCRRVFGAAAGNEPLELTFRNRKIKDPTFGARTTAEQRQHHHETRCEVCMTISTQRTKATVWSELEAEATKTRTANETTSQAVARFLETPRGCELYREYNDAEVGGERSTVAAPAAPVRGPAEKLVIEQIERKAREFQERDLSLTREAAIARVVSAYPEAYSKYLDARRADELVARRGT